MIEVHIYIYIYILARHYALTGVMRVSDSVNIKDT